MSNVIKSCVHQCCTIIIFNKKQNLIPNETNNEISEFKTYLKIFTKYSFYCSNILCIFKLNVDFKCSICILLVNKLSFILMSRMELLYISQNAITYQIILIQ